MIFSQSSLILLFLFVLGLPLSFCCLRTRTPTLFLHLAPHCGLALLVIIAANSYLLNVPVSRTVLPVLCLCLVNAVGIVLYCLKRVRNVKGTFGDLVSSIASRSRASLIPTLLFGAVCLIYALPFILNPSMVFYAYAGTDGYAYMSVAGYQMSHGVYDVPSTDIYHVYSGLIAALTDIRRGVDKPGTMAVLAFFSSLLSKLPHEVFSPLVLTCVALTFLSVFALAKSLGFAPTLSGLAGFLSTVSLPVLALSSNTYLGATITVSLLPVILVLAQDTLVNRKSGFLLIVVYTAYFLFSPVSLMIPIIAVFLYIGYSGFKRLRGEAKVILANAALLLGCFFVININPLVQKLYVSKQSDILNYVAAPRYFARSVLFGQTVTVYREPMDSVHRQLSWNLFWHTLGVGPIMASSGTKLEILARIVLGLVLLIAILFLACALLRRDFSILFFSYLSFWLLVLVGGIGGVFRSFEILSRVSQQFVPLHSLVYLSFVNNKDPIYWKSLLRRGALIVALLIIMLYPLYPFSAFVRTSLLNHPQRINQYFQSSLRAREDVSRIVGRSPVLLNSSVPTYTGLANIATLFSNVQLAIPPAFLKFFFLDRLPRPENYFCAPTVLTSELYTDVYDENDEKILYRKNGFRISKNDLMLFFDNDTFEIKHGFDVEFLKTRSYAQARKLGTPTVMHACSTEARTVRLTFRYTPLIDGRVFTLSVNPGLASGRIVFGSEGTITTRPFPLSKGVNQIELRPESAGGRVEILGISLKAEG